MIRSGTGQVPLVTDSEAAGMGWKRKRKRSTAGDVRSFLNVRSFISTHPAQSRLERLDGSEPGSLGLKQTEALNHPLRLRILEMHKRARGGPLSIQTLTALLAQTEDYRHVSAAEVSYHRARLLDADLLSA